MNDQISPVTGLTKVRPVIFLTVTEKLPSVFCVIGTVTSDDTTLVTTKFDVVFLVLGTVLTGVVMVDGGYRPGGASGADGFDGLIGLFGGTLFTIILMIC